MNYYIIAPNHDVDSIISHVIGQIWQKSIIHKTIEYGIEDEPLRDIPLTNEQKIILSDFGYSKSLSNEIMINQLIELKNNGANINFFDQHNWPRKIIKSAFNSYHHSTLISSSELMAKTLTPNNNIALFLGRLATYDDYNIDNENAKKLEDLVNSRIPKNQFIYELANLPTPELSLSQDANNELYIYRYEKNNSIKLLRQSYTFCNTSLGPFVFGLAPTLLYMKPGHRTIKSDYPKINFLCFYENKIQCTFRTTNKKLFSKIKILFHGGGRENEGGFTLIEPVNKENFSDVLNKLMNKLQ